MRRRSSISLALALALTLLSRAIPAAPPDAAGDIEETVQSTAIPELFSANSASNLVGKPITRIDVITLGDRWLTSPRVTSVLPGDALSIEAGRRAVRELLATNRFARASAQASPDGEGAALRIEVLPRRLIAAIQVHGSALDTKGALEAAGVSVGGEITSPMLSAISSKIQAFYVNHGFPLAAVNTDAADTDDPLRVALTIDIKPGAPRVIARRVFVVDPAADAQIGDLKQRYALGAGARVDEGILAQADHDLADALRQAGFHRAEVTHTFQDVGGQSYLYVHLTPGPRIVPAFEGNRAFDDSDLTQALALTTSAETRPAELIDRLRAFYVNRGFLDVEIQAAEQGKPDDPIHHLVFTIRENKRVRVTHRVFPCLTGEKTPNDVGKEIESFLVEELPGGDPFWSGNQQVITSLFGPTQGAGGRAKPLELVPATTYAPATYDRALKHLRDLFHSQGYLNAVVGPVSVVRATCDRRSPAGTCIPEAPTIRVFASCPKDALGLPEPEPPLPEALTCKPDPSRHIECAEDITLRIPIHLGPQTVLYDIAFEGNRAFSDRRLAEVADLPLGGPLSNLELEAARLRVLDAYRDRGFAYVDVRTSIDPSPDRTRARARFLITERELVIVSDFVVRGNTYTEESLIRARLALQKNGPYQQDLVRLSEERIATLGAFSSISIGLEDADVPQKNKRVIITVAEQLPQYLDPRIGFSTGEGLRFAFEYGHRNIAGQAISLTLRVQLSYLFEFMTLDPAVRDNYSLLPISGRLERRNTASITFPEIGLGPLISFSLDGIDVRDNQRDFGLTRDAVIPTLTYRPRREISAQLSASAELNDVQVFQCIRDASACDQTVDTRLESLLLAPKGRTLAFAQQAKFGWDMRDNSFAATKGFLLTGSVEHVNAFPSEVSGNRAEIKSHFLRFNGRVAGYFPLPFFDASVALSLGAGYNLQLNDASETYPDRLFFLGGVDSLRAFTAASVIPEDVARQIQKGDVQLGDVKIRGGNLSLNPRAEIRVPLNDTFNVGIFLDTGNLWKEPADVELFSSLYAAGGGLRISTPIGPLALDYGINLRRRAWEDFGAFHFSIGLF